MARPVVLVVDDDPGVRESFRLILEDHYDVTDVPDGPTALDVVRTSTVDLVLLDIRLPGMDGIEVLERIKALDEGIEVILVTAVKTVRTAVDAMKLGAFDYLTKPFDLNEVKALAARALEARRLASQLDQPLLAVHGRNEQIIGRSPAMQEVYKTIGRVVKSDATVLIQGESGTGKELIARIIHHYSTRWRAPFVAINCSAIPVDLLESEFFGHERGAFTGAVERRSGKFEQACGGTLFLDEVPDMPPALQAKILRVLQEREFTRVGGRETIKADVRIIAATNQDLATAVKEQRFREDLYFRLRVVPITLPPLRQRRDDIPELISYFIDKINREMGTSVAGVSPAAQALLIQHSWPGNVRELENTLLRAAVLAPGRMLTPADLSLPAAASVLLEDFADLSFEEVVRRKLKAYFQQTTLLEPCDLHAIVIGQVEKPLIELTLEYTSGNQLKAAELLGINRNTLRKKITDLKIVVKK